MKWLFFLLGGCASMASGPSVYVRPDAINPQEGCPQTWAEEVRTELSRQGFNVVYDENVARELTVRVGGTWPKWGCNAQPSHLEVSRSGPGVAAYPVHAEGAEALVKKLKDGLP